MEGTIDLGLSNLTQRASQDYQDLFVDPSSYTIAPNGVQYEYPDPQIASGPIPPYAPYTTRHTNNGCNPNNSELVPQFDGQQPQAATYARLHYHAVALPAQCSHGSKRKRYAQTDSERTSSKAQRREARWLNRHTSRKIGKPGHRHPRLDKLRRSRDYDGRQLRSRNGSQRGTSHRSQRTPIAEQSTCPVLQVVAAADLADARIELVKQLSIAGRVVRHLVPNNPLTEDGARDAGLIDNDLDGRDAARAAYTSERHSRNGERPRRPNRRGFWAVRMEREYEREVESERYRKYWEGTPLRWEIKRNTRMKLNPCGKRLVTILHREKRVRGFGHDSRGLLKEMSPDAALAHVRGISREMLTKASLDALASRLRAGQVRL